MNCSTVSLLGQRAGIGRAAESHGRGEGKNGDSRGMMWLRTAVTKFRMIMPAASTAMPTHTHQRSPLKPRICTQKVTMQARKTCSLCLVSRGHDDHVLPNIPLNHEVEKFCLTLHDWHTAFNKSHSW